MSVLKYNLYTFVPTPRVTIDETPLGSQDGPQQAFRETWNVKGELLGGQVALIAAKDALVAALAVNAGDLTLFRDDGVTVMQQLLNSGCLNGTHVVKAPSFPRGEGAVFATHLPYEVAVSGVKTRADKLEDDAWGEVTTSTTAGQDGRSRKIVQGHFLGSGRQAAADARKLTVDVVVVREEQIARAHEDRIDFRYEYVDTSEDSREVYSFVETVTMSTDYSSKVFRKVLGGAAPTRQTTVLNEVRGTQEGSAIGLTGYPSAPGPLWSSADYSAPPVTVRKSPQRLHTGLTGYEIRWRYEFAWSSTVVSGPFQNPNTPPE